MREIFLTKRFTRDYEKLPPKLQKRCDEKLLLLLKNPKYPSLRTKKLGTGYKVAIWEGRVTEKYRFTYQIVRESYVIRRVGSHTILKNP